MAELVGVLVWLVLERSFEAALLAGLSAVAAGVSLRALVVVRDDTVYRRRLLGWAREPLLLADLREMSLRREVWGRLIPLVLRLSGRSGTGVKLACWEWSGWRELAHRTGHVADQLEIPRDEVTRRRTSCRLPTCSAARAVQGFAPATGPVHSE